MLNTRTRLSSFACLQDAAGAALKKAGQALGLVQPKNRLRLRKTNIHNVLYSKCRKPIEALLNSMVLVPTLHNLVKNKRFVNCYLDPT